jgi:3-hydroxyacyl-[acyl-carrier-protein] dehydratase
VPGDQLHYHVRKLRSRGRVWRFYGEARVNGHVVAEAEVSAMIADSAEARAFAAQKNA